MMSRLPWSGFIVSNIILHPLRKKSGLPDSRRVWPSVFRKGVRALLAGCGFLLPSCFSNSLDSSIGLGSSIGTPDFREAIEKATDIPWQNGHSVDTLPNGDSFFAAMLGEVCGAQKSIILEIFAFVRAPVTRRFSRSLAERARAGVEVKVILDAVGSRRAGEENLRMMREAGVEVRLFHPMNVLRPWHSNNRTHRKILVVDGKVAFTGGAGFAQAWEGDARTRKEWRDTGMRFVVRRWPVFRRPFLRIGGS